VRIFTTRPIVSRCGAAGGEYEYNRGSREAGRIGPAPSEGSHVLADLSRPEKPRKGHNTTKDEKHKVSNERNESLITAGVLIDAMKTLEPTEMAPLFAPESIVWHNTDGIEQKRDEFLVGLGSLRSACNAVQCTADIDVQECDTTTSGFVQTYRWFFRTPGQPTVEIPCAMWVTLDDEGKITRFEEYLDSVGANALNAVLAGG
jgi:hypothetical protein